MINFSPLESICLALPDGFLLYQDQPSFSGLLFNIFLIDFVMICDSIMTYKCSINNDSNSSSTMFSKSVVNKQFENPYDECQNDKEDPIQIFEKQVVNIIDHKHISIIEKKVTSEEFNIKNLKEIDEEDSQKKSNKGSISRSISIRSEKPNSENLEIPKPPIQTKIQKTRTFGEISSVSLQNTKVSSDYEIPVSRVNTYGPTYSFTIKKSSLEFSEIESQLQDEKNRSLDEKALSMNNEEALSINLKEGINDNLVNQKKNDNISFGNIAPEITFGIEKIDSNTLGSQSDVNGDKNSDLLQNMPTKIMIDNFKEKLKLNDDQVECLVVVNEVEHLSNDGRKSEGEILSGEYITRSFYQPNQSDGMNSKLSHNNSMESECIPRTPTFSANPPEFVPGQKPIHDTKTPIFLNSDHGLNNFKFDKNYANRSAESLRSVKQKNDYDIKIHETSVQCTNKEESESQSQFSVSSVKNPSRFYDQTFKASSVESKHYDNIIQKMKETIMLFDSNQELITSNLINLNQNHMHLPITRIINKDFFKQEKLQSKKLTKIDLIFETNSEVKILTNYTTMKRLMKIYDVLKINLRKKKVKINLPFLKESFKNIKTETQKGLLSMQSQEETDKISEVSSYHTNYNDCKKEINPNFKVKIDFQEFLTLMQLFFKFFNTKSIKSWNIPGLNLTKPMSLVFSYQSALIEFCISGFPQEPVLFCILTDMKEKLSLMNYEDKNKFKNSLLHSISHELRTPQNYCSPVLEIVIEKVTNLFGQMMERFDITMQQKVVFDEVYSDLINASNSVKHMNLQLNGIIDFTTIETKELSIKPVTINVVDAIMANLELYESIRKQKNQEVTVHIDNKNFSSGKNQLMWNTDINRFCIIFTMIYHNSIKFTNEGGVKIYISKEGDSQEKEDILTVCIIDSGIGIEPKQLSGQQNTISNRVSSFKTDNSSGIGLGLRIASELQRYLGCQSYNKLSIDSSINQGTTVTIYQRYMKFESNKINIKDSPDSSIDYSEISNFANVDFSNLSLTGDQISYDRLPKKVLNLVKERDTPSNECMFSILKNRIESHNSLQNDQCSKDAMQSGSKDFSIVSSSESGPIRTNTLNNKNGKSHVMVLRSSTLQEKISNEQQALEKNSLHITKNVSFKNDEADYNSDFEIAKDMMMKQPINKIDDVYEGSRSIDIDRSNNNYKDLGSGNRKFDKFCVEKELERKNLKCQRASYQLKIQELDKKESLSEIAEEWNEEENAADLSSKINYLMQNGINDRVKRHGTINSRSRGELDEQLQVKDEFLNSNISLNLIPIKQNDLDRSFEKVSDIKIDYSKLKIPCLKKNGKYLSNQDFVPLEDLELKIDKKLVKSGMIPFNLGIIKEEDNSFDDYVLNSGEKTYNNKYQLVNNSFGLELPIPSRSSRFSFTFGTSDPSSCGNSRQIPYPIQDSFCSSYQKDVDNFKKKITEQECNCNNILIVDDEVMNHMVIKAMQKDFDFQMDCAMNGLQALHMVKDKNLKCDHCWYYKVIIMDFNMPVMGGVQACQEILAFLSKKSKKQYNIHKAKHKLVVLGYTAYTDETTADQAIKAGMQTIISKPVTKDKFVEILKEIDVL